MNEQRESSWMNIHGASSVAVLSCNEVISIENLFIKIFMWKISATVTTKCNETWKNFLFIIAVDEADLYGVPSEVGCELEFCV